LYRAGNDESAQAGALNFLPGRRAIERGNLSAFTSTCSTIVSSGSHHRGRRLAGWRCGFAGSTGRRLRRPRPVVEPDAAVRHFGELPLSNQTLRGAEGRQHPALLTLFEMKRPARGKVTWADRV